MPTNDAQQPNTTGDEASSTEATGTPATFTQEQVNAFVAEAKRKTRDQFADYEDLKAKAAQFDQAQDAAKSDLQRASERADKAEKDLAAATDRITAMQHQILVAEVAAAKGVPAGNLTGTTREELEASADALLAWAGPRQEEPRRGFVPKAATGTGERHASSMQAGRERARAKQAARNTTI
ncbi:hypothetical protein [Brachybacterium timonense]|uniref:hypothetical protein n=1 Tax=Brachybacterium timonense TaxID=2050896 RepID=UPI000D0BD275|nr:hypothetical protein [Brachybacterium timonense]